MSERLDTVLGRLGYVPTNASTTSQGIELRSDSRMDVEAPYPQVVMVQGRSAGESWVRDHAGQLLLAAGVGVFGLVALAVVAMVAIVTAIAMVGIAASLTVLKGIAATQTQSPRRGSRR